MVRDSIQKLWTDFQKKVIAPNAPAHQVRDMRMAFHAGFFSMLLMAMRLGETDVSEDAGILYLEQLRKEMNNFKP